MHDGISLAVGAHWTLDFKVNLSLAMLSSYPPTYAGGATICVYANHEQRQCFYESQRSEVESLISGEVGRQILFWDFFLRLLYMVLLSPISNSAVPGGSLSTIDGLI